MKLLKCIVQPEKLDHVRDALTTAGVQGMTVSEVRGFGRLSAGPHANGEYTDSLVTQMEIEVVVPDSMARLTMDAMLVSARSGNRGDGKIFILDVDQAVRIRTGESDDAAL